MAMAWIWTAMIAFSVIFGLISGNINAVGSAALDGAGAAVQLCIAIAGVTMLWSGVMEIMRRAGLAQKLSRFFRPALTRIFPQTRGNEPAMEALSANVSANLLGLGNAATPLGIRAATEMAKMTRKTHTASNDLCMLVVLNSASIQLIPATVAAVRASAGARSPFDILPAVWITSIVSLFVGITIAKFLAKFTKRGGGD